MWTVQQKQMSDGECLRSHSVAFPRMLVIERTSKDVCSALMTAWRFVCSHSPCVDARQFLTNHSANTNLLTNVRSVFVRYMRMRLKSADPTRGCTWCAKFKYHTGFHFAYWITTNTSSVSQLFLRYPRNYLGASANCGGYICLARPCFRRIWKTFTKKWTPRNCKIRKISKKVSKNFWIFRPRWDICTTDQGCYSYVPKTFSLYQRSLFALNRALKSTLEFHLFNKLLRLT